MDSQKPENNVSHSKTVTKPYGKIVLSLNNCILPESKLSLTPSKLDGLDSETETDLRILGCEMIQTGGILLRLPQVAMATGQVLFQRFYYSKSFVRYPMETTAMACLFLASKVEETPRRIRDVMSVFHHMKQIKSQKTIQPMLINYHYIILEKQVIIAERRVLKELGFCVHVKHPHKIIVMYLQVLGYEKHQPIMQLSWNYMNDSLRSDVFVRYDPETVACACIYLSARRLRIPLPKQPPWFGLFGISEDHIVDVCKRILRLYQRGKVNTEELEKKVEELRKNYQESTLKACGQISGNNAPNSGASLMARNNHQEATLKACGQISGNNAPNSRATPSARNNHVEKHQRSRWSRLPTSHSPQFKFRSHPRSRNRSLKHRSNQHSRARSRSRSPRSHSPQYKFRSHSRSRNRSLKHERSKKHSRTRSRSRSPRSHSPQYKFRSHSRSRNRSLKHERSKKHSQTRSRSRSPRSHSPQYKFRSHSRSRNRSIKHKRSKKHSQTRSRSKSPRSHSPQYKFRSHSRSRNRSIKHKRSKKHSQTRSRSRSPRSHSPQYKFRSHSRSRNRSLKHERSKKHSQTRSRSRSPRSHSPQYKFRSHSRSRNRSLKHERSKKHSRTRSRSKSPRSHSPQYKFRSHSRSRNRSLKHKRSKKHSRTRSRSRSPRSHSPQFRSHSRSRNRSLKHERSKKHSRTRSRSRSVERRLEKSHKFRRSSHTSSPSPTYNHSRSRYRSRSRSPRVYNNYYIDKNNNEKYYSDKQSSCLMRRDSYETSGDIERSRHFLGNHTSSDVPVTPLVLCPPTITHTNGLSTSQIQGTDLAHVVPVSMTSTTVARSATYRENNNNYYNNYENYYTDMESSHLMHRDSYETGSYIERSRQCLGNHTSSDVPVTPLVFCPPTHAYGVGTNHVQGTNHDRIVPVSMPIIYRDSYGTSEDRLRSSNWPMH